MISLNLDYLTNSIITALIIGAFVSIENYIMQKHVLKNLELLSAKIKNGNGGKRNVE